MPIAPYQNSGRYYINGIREFWYKQQALNKKRKGTNVIDMGNDNK